MAKNFVSAIVPAFNEEKTVAGVIKVLLGVSLIDEIIAINDGSIDNTLSELKQFEDQISIINLEKNQGKGNALAEALKIAKGEIVVFIDADLTTLSEEHINLLLSPILDDNFKAVLGFPTGKSKVNIFSDLTGERAYYKADLIPYLDEISHTRFGVEVFINNLFSKAETKKIPLVGLRGLFKYEKQDPTTALKEYIKEGIEIAKTIGNKEVLPDSDFKILKDISELTNLAELKIKVGKINNIKIKIFLEKYFIKYIKIVTRNSD